MDRDWQYTVKIDDGAVHHSENMWRKVPCNYVMKRSAAWHRAVLLNLHKRFDSAQQHQEAEAHTFSNRVAEGSDFTFKLVKSKVHLLLNRI